VEEGENEEEGEEEEECLTPVRQVYENPLDRYKVILENGEFSFSYVVGIGSILYKRCVAERRVLHSIYLELCNRSNLYNKAF